MGRSNSLARAPLQRTASWGYLNTPAYGREPYNTLNLARRPRDRLYSKEGFSVLTAYFPPVGRSSSDVQSTSSPLPLFFSFFTDPPHRISRSFPQKPSPAPPHPTPLIYFDLRHHLFLPEHIHFVNLNQFQNAIDLAQLVCQPSSSFSQISHPLLPSYIDVHQFHPNCVTVNGITAPASLRRSPRHEIEPLRHLLNHAVYYCSPLYHAVGFFHHRDAPELRQLHVSFKGYIFSFTTFSCPRQIRRWCTEKTIAVGKSNPPLNKVDTDL